MRRILPAIGLFFLAPLVAEYLLGDLPITFLIALVLLTPLYGGGALLIREVARRMGRGWPTILVLGIAYGVLEEGVTTMSLFNPNYADAHLLDYGYIPQLGISLPWTVGVITLHAVGSISMPIALVEALATPRRTTPWLGSIGLGLVTLVFLLGVVANTAFSIATYHFVASPLQFIAVGVIIVVLVFAALSLGSSGSVPAAHAERSAPNPWLVGIASLIMCSLLKSIPWFPHSISPWLVVFLMLVLEVVAILVVYSWSRLPGWGESQQLALVGGALLTYAWTSFPQPSAIPVSLTVDLISNVIFSTGAIALLVIAAMRLRAGATTQPVVGHDNETGWQPGMHSGEH